jgi:hypothetical protein
MGSFNKIIQSINNRIIAAKVRFQFLALENPSASKRKKKKGKNFNEKPMRHTKMPTSLSEQVKRTELFSRETENSELRTKEKNQRKYLIGNKPKIKTTPTGCRIGMIKLWTQDIAAKGKQAIQTCMPKKKKGQKKTGMR